VSTITLPDDGGATVGDLLREITEKTSIAHFDIKYSYPPKPLPLDQSQRSQLLSDLEVKLNGEQLIISAKEAPKQEVPEKKIPTKDSSPSKSSKAKSSGPVSLKKKSMVGDVPEIPFPERGATVVLRVMPDDNSCLFRAFGTAVVPGDDRSMHELRSIVATAVQSQPDIYSKVVLEQEPDNYCAWIQTSDAWGGAIELNILANFFDVEICSIDVQSGRVDRYNEDAPRRCILVYSGIHYDLIVQSPSEPPHTRATNTPDFDKRIFDSDDDEILIKAQELCNMLQAKHYYTDTGGMAIRCEDCDVVVYGQAQAQVHAEQTGHYNMAEVRTAKS